MAARDSAPPEVFRPHTREDLDDLHLLPRRFDMLASEVRDLAAAVRAQAAAFGAQAEALRDLQQYLVESNRQLHDRLDELKR